MTLPGSRRGPAGFTLIEVMVVVVILGLVAGLVMTRGESRSRTMEARAAASDIARTLRGARGQAIGSNRPVLVLFDTARRAMAVDGGPIRVLPSGFALAVAAAPGETRRNLAGIRFAPDGSASGGRIEIGDGRTRMAVGVDWLTGRVSVRDAAPPRG